VPAIIRDEHHKKTTRLRSKGSLMKFRFWGVRGSIPSPGPRTVRYGGNTTCIEVRSDDGTLIVLDAGTGMYALAQDLMAPPRRKTAAPSTPTSSSPTATGTTSTACPSSRRCS
jgi:hypothetical protein